MQLLCNLFGAASIRAGVSRATVCTAALFCYNSLSHCGFFSGLSSLVTVAGASGEQRNDSNKRENFLHSNRYLCWTYNRTKIDIKINMTIKIFIFLQNNYWLNSLRAIRSRAKKALGKTACTRPQRAICSSPVRHFPTVTLK